jgi:hypothetical protein
VVQLAAVAAALLIVAFWRGGTAPAALYLSAAILLAACLYNQWTGAFRRSDRLRALAWALALCVLWLALYTIPLPVRAIEFCGLQRADQMAAVATAHRLFERAQPDSAVMTMNLAGSLRLLLVALGASAAMWLTATMPPARRRQLIAGLVGLGVVAAVSGIASLVYPPSQRLWWWFGPLPQSGAAAFVNPNHYGAFLAMLCPAAAALCIRRGEQLNRRRLMAAVALLAVLIAGVVASR